MADSRPSADGFTGCGRRAVGSSPHSVREDGHYTTFALSNLHLSASSVSTSGTLTVSADLTNTGAVAGDDVAQHYIHEDGTSILQPVCRLEGFQRVTLAPGQTKTVTFTLGPSNIGFYNNLGQFAVEPGAVNVYVGDSSVGGLQGQFTVHN